MKQGLICELSPLCRPASQRKMRRKRLIAGKKEGPGRITPKSHQTELSQDNNAFEQSSSKSPGKNCSDLLAKSSKGMMRMKQVQALKKKGSHKLRTQHHVSDLSLQAGVSDGTILPSNKSSEVKTGPVLAGSSKGPNPHSQRDNRTCLAPDLSNGKESYRSLSADSKSPGFQNHYKGMLSISPSHVLASLTKSPEVDSQRNNEMRLKQHQIKKSDQMPSDPSQSHGFQKRHIVVPFGSPGKQARSMNISDKLNQHPRVTQVAVDMNKISETRDFDIKKRKMDSQPNDSDILLKTPRGDVSGLSSINSRSIIINDSLASLQQGPVDDNPQGTGNSHDQHDKINIKKSSSPGTLLATACSRGAQKSSSLSRRTQLPWRGKSPRHRTVSMTTVDMKKLKEAYDILTETEEDIGKRVADNQTNNSENSFISERNEDIRSKSSRGEPDCFSPRLSSNKSEDSGKLQSMDSELQGINDIDPPSEEALRKKHTSSLSKSPRMRKRRKSLPFLSPGKQLLSQSMHGLDQIHQRHTVTMTTVEKLQEAINSQISRKRKRREENKHGEHDPENSFISERKEDVRSKSPRGEPDCFSPRLSSSKSEDSGKLQSMDSELQSTVSELQGINDIDPPSEVALRKKCAPSLSKSPRMRKRRKSLPFLSPGKQLLSQSMHGLDQIHRRHTVTMTTVEKLQEAINSQISRKRKRMEETKHGEHNFSLSTSDHDVSRSSSSSGIEANAFLVDLISSKTKDSSQNTERVADFQRMDGRHQKYEMANRKESSLHVKGPAALEILEEGKQGSSVLVITPANSVLPQGVKDRTEIKKGARRHPDVSDFTHRQKDGNHEQTGQQTMHHLGSTDFTIRTVATENTKKQFQEATNVPRKHTVQQEPEIRETAVASKKKKQREIFVNPSGFGVPIKSGRTPDFNFKKLDEMYKRRFDPSQECTEMQNVNTICRIRSFQDRQKESRQGNISDIQRYAFNGDMAETESDVSDSDEANETLLEREIRSFFESTGDSKEFKEGELAGDETRSQGLSVIGDGVSDDEVPEAGQILPLPNDLKWTDRESSIGTALPVENNYIPDKIADSLCGVEHVLKTDLSTFNDTPSSLELAEDLDGLQNGLHALVDMQRLSKSTCTNTLEKLNDSGSVQNLDGSIISILDSEEDIENLPKLTDNLPKTDSNYESIESETFLKNDCYEKASFEAEDKELQDEAKTHTTSYDFGESLIMDSEEEGLWEDACTPFQHSTPTGQRHHPGACITAIPDDINMAFKAIKKEKNLFMLLCHVDAAHRIYEDLGNCPDIIDKRSLSLRYLKHKPSVVVEGMTVDDCTVFPCQSTDKQGAVEKKVTKKKKKEMGTKTKEEKKKKTKGRSKDGTQKKKTELRKQTKEEKKNVTSHLADYISGMVVQ